MSRLVLLRGAAASLIVAVASGMALAMPAVAANPPTSPSPGAAGPAAPAPAPASAVPVPQLEAALHALRTDRGLRIVLPADELFGAARDTLDANADPLLTKLAELIAATRPREVVIAGHTDSVGKDEDNQSLSEARAHKVADWLAARAPKGRPRFVEQGYGRIRPVAPNHIADGSDNPAGRAQNRRIEVLLRR